MDIRLDMNPISPGFGDAVFINGPLTEQGVTHGRVEVVAQRLRLRLMTFRTEWFMNTGYGIPYLDILGRKPSKGVVDRTFQQAILEENGVAGIDSFSSSFSNRQYKATFRVRVGDEVSDPISITL